MISKKDISNNEIFVVNDILNDQELTELWYHANSCGYKYTQRSTPLSNKNQKRLTHHDPIDGFVETTVWKKLEKLFAAPIGLTDAYINFSDMSSRSIAHSDGLLNEASILMCLNQHWDRDWGGYTCFFKDINGSEIIKTVCPVPGQIIIFNGFKWHIALPPTIFAEVPRFMLALKLMWLEDKDKKEI